MDPAHGNSRVFERLASEIARRACGEGGRVVATSATPIAHRVIRETTAGLSRIVLHVARADGTGATELSLVAKRMQGDSPNGSDPARANYLPSDEPAHPNYWRREYDVFGSTLLECLPAPLRAPLCFAREIESRAATVWLEDVAGTPPDTWKDDRFFAIARALGAWQRANAGDGVAARPPWLARGSLRMWSPRVDGSAHVAAMRDDLFASSRAERAFGPAMRECVRTFWNERDASLEMLERVPQTLSHGDFWTRNLLSSSASRGDVVVIDWSEIGIGPFAHDLVNLVLDSVWMFDISVGRLGALEAAVLQGYCDGWNSAGGPDASSRIEEAYRANARLRMGSLAGILLSQAANGVKRATAEERYGRPYDDVFETRAAVVRATFRL